MPTNKKRLGVVSSTILTDSNCNLPFPISEKPYTCNFCEKRFTQKGNLDAHLKTHTKEKPYPCPHPRCEKKFSFKSSMLSHVKQNHNGHQLTVATQHLPGGNHLEYDEDDIANIKQQIKYSSTAAPNPAALPADFPVSPNNFSSGIPTPQSSLDSIPGGCTQQHAPPLGYQSASYTSPQPPTSAASAAGAAAGPCLHHPDAPSTPHSRSTPEMPLSGVGEPSLANAAAHTAETSEQSNISKLAQAVQSVTAAAATVSSRVTASDGGGEECDGGGGAAGRQTLAIS